MAEDGGSTALAEVMTRAVARLEAAGAGTPALDARLLLEAATGLSRADQLAAPERPLAPEERAAFERLVARRAAREPVAQIVGRKGFWTLELAVSPDVLTPRPETEHVVEAALALLPQDKPARALDLGVGSGAMLLALLSERTGLWGLGVDRSEAALRVAAENARMAGLSDRAAFVCADWDDGVGGGFDCVVSNPPYIPSQELAALSPETRADPPAALDGGADGLDFYRRLAAGLPRLLRRGGFATVELGAGQASDVTEILSASAELCQIETRLDLAGETRVAIVRRR